MITEGNPNYSLAGAKYGVYYGNALIGTITTDENGTGTLENVLVGDYTVKEMEPSRGYAIETSGHNVSVNADQRTDISVKEVPQSNPMDVLLCKLDSETGKAEPQGAASLEGAEFKVEFYAAFSGPRSAKAKAGADRTWIFKTDAEGKVSFTKAYLVSGDDFYYQSDGKTICLPLGKVVITETKAPEGYLLNGEVFTAYITSAGVKETVKTYNEQSVPEQVKRGDLEFVKVSDGDLKRLEGVPFTITSLTTGESHTIVTDKNGYASTAASWNRHSHNTNAGKTSEDGIWFGTSKPDDTKGALIYDDYEIAEQRCKANEGMDLLKVKVSVYKDSVTIPMGTMTDDRIEIGTTATYDTGQKVSKAERHVTIEDVVRYSGLQAGKTYLIKGKLIDKSTGMPLLVDGKEVVSEKKFTAENSSGEVMVSFTFDASDLSSRKIVVFENLYEDDTEIAAHADIADEGQTVSLESDYPSNSPKTGDDTKLYVLFALMVAAGLAATAVQVVRKKKHSKAQKEIEE